MFGKRTRVAEIWDRAAGALGGELKIGGYDEVVVHALIDGIDVRAEEDLPASTLIHAMAPHAGGLHLHGGGEHAWLWVVREALVAVDPRYRFELVRGVATARRAGVEGEAELLVGAMRGVAALASGGLRLAAAWRELVADLEGRWRDNRGGLIRGEGSFALQRDGVDVVVSCEGQDIEVWCPLAPGERRRWPGHVPDRDRIEAAIAEVVAALPTPSPYR